jgi:16S rRNA processing protein RimM
MLVTAPSKPRDNSKFAGQYMIRVGKIVAAHGLNGTLVLTHILGTAKWLKKGQAIMVEVVKGSYIPFFVAALKAVNSDEFYINLEDVSTVMDAKKLVTKYVYVDGATLKEYAKKIPLLWIGFQLTDTEKGELGTIADIYQTANQWVGKIIIDGAEVLIPLVDPLVQKVDIKLRRVSITLPEGLIEIYTGK